MLSPAQNLLPFIRASSAGVLDDQFGATDAWRQNVRLLSPFELGNMLFEVVTLHDALSFLRDQLWVFAQENNLGSSSVEKQGFLDEIFLNELSSFAFYREFLNCSDKAVIKQTQKRLTQFASVILQELQTAGIERRRSVAAELVRLMAEAFQHEADRSSLRASPKNFSYYRSFDFLDDILGLSYETDYSMSKAPHISERLYEGGGRRCSVFLLYFI